MTSSHVRSRRTTSGEPPTADRRLASDTAVADPSTAPDRFTEITQALGTLTTSGVDAPSTGPVPPQVSGVQAVAAAGWSYNQAITHLFSYDTAVGVWVFVNNIGWKRLSPASESGATAMTVIATMATHDNLPVNYHEDAAGLIDQMYA